jgi:predicted MFS family arabinose efflux permease
LADFAFLPRVVRPEQLVDANGLLAASQSAAEISGKGIGGLIVQALSAPVAVLADALSYLASGINLLRLRVTEPVPAPHSDPARSPWREARGGVRVVVRNRYVRPLLGEATTFNLFNEVFILGLLLYAVRDLDLNPAQLGLVFTAGGVGSFLGAWFGARVTGRFGYGRVLLATLILGNTAPVATLLPATTPAPALIVLGSSFLLIGIGTGIANVHAVSLRQTAIPDRLHGRVNAGYRLISWGAIPIGATAGGLLAAQLGGHAAMAVGALGIPLATLWVAVSPVPRLTSIRDVAAIA